MRFITFAFAVLGAVSLAACTPPSSPPAAAPPAGAPGATNLGALTGSAKVTTASGIVFESVQAGSGPSPKATDTVKVHYRGTFPDGREFDSSYKRGEPTSFPLNRVIPCWTEAVQMMKPGGKARITCPSRLAYGERGAGGVIPPNATLVFDIELISIGG
jgi:FKBP-type peptidyl-prolyl cis-trans isomerase FkpA